tara:strand:+ start:306 stop:2264 length:1959 start_codon:yes stop_codon:yes gene_type:complete
MARVTGKYDVRMRTQGPSAFSEFTSAYLNVAVPLNKERYIRELEYASPKRAYSELMQEKEYRRTLMQDLLKLQQPSGRQSSGGSFRRSRVKDTRKAGEFIDKLRDEHLEAQAEMKTGRDQVEDPDVSTIVEHLKGGDLDSATNQIKRITKDFGDSEKVGYGLGVLQEASRQLDSNQQKQLKLALQKSQAFIRQDTKLRVDLDKTEEANSIIFRTFQGPTVTELADGRKVRFSKTMTDSDIKTYYDLREPKETQTVTSPLGRRKTTDNSTIIAEYQKAIKDSTAKIKSLEGEYNAARQNYQNLLRGPSFNLALSATREVPSKFGETLDNFSLLRQSDPDFASEFLNQAKTRFEAPNLYDDFETLPMAQGVSPIDMILDSAKNMSLLTRGPSAESSDFSQVSDDDVNMLAEEAKRLSQIVNSPLHRGFAKNQTVTIGGDEDGDGIIGSGESEEIEIPLTDFITNTASAFEKRNDPEQRRAIAESFTDGMFSYESGLDDKTIKSLQIEGNSNQKVSGVLRNMIKEIDYGAKTGDQSYALNAINEANQLLSSSSFGGAALMEAQSMSEQFRRLPTEKQNIAIYNARAKELADQLDLINAKNVVGEAIDYNLPTEKETEQGTPEGDTIETGEGARGEGVFGFLPVFSTEPRGRDDRR